MESTLGVNHLPFTLTTLQHNKNSEHYELCFRLIFFVFLQIAFGDISQLCSCMLGLTAWLSTQNFERERKTAEEANTERADILVRLIFASLSLL